MPTDISLRPLQELDLPFLYRVYASTREEELSVVPWSAEQKADFLRMQFESQHAYYHEQFPASSFDLVLVNGEPVGRLYLDRRGDEIRIIDIALLAEFRGQGTGSKLLREILQEARDQQIPVRIHVESNNPAMSLSRRLGFEMIEEQGVYYLMEYATPVS